MDGAGGEGGLAQHLGGKENAQRFPAHRTAAQQDPFSTTGIGQRQTGRAQSACQRAGWLAAYGATVWISDNSPKAMALAKPSANFST
jgi:hypothetical protein